MEALFGSGQVLDANAARTQWSSPFTMVFHLSTTAPHYSASVSPSRLEITPNYNSQQQASSDSDSSNADESRSFNSVVTVDFDKLPKPSILGSFLGNFNEQSMRTQIIAEAMRLYPLIYPELKRGPTQEEAERIAWHTALGIQKGSIGPSVGTTLALINASRTSMAGHWYFPLPFRVPRSYDRGPGFDPNIVRIAGREMLRGQAAQTFHRSVRGLLYGIIGYSLGAVYARYQVSSALLEAAKDPKLAQIKDAVVKTARNARERAQAQMADRVGGGAASRSPGQQGIQTIDAKQDQENRSWDSRNSGQDSMTDDASPTGGSGMSDGFYASGDIIGEEQVAQATTASERRSDERLADIRQRVQARLERKQSGGRSDSDGGDFWLESSSQSQSQRPVASVQSTGSAWDRLRRDGARPPINYDSASNQPASRVEPSSSQADSEKDQAQREFDAMLERERGGSESSRKW